MKLVLMVLSTAVPILAQIEPSGGIMSQPLHPGHTVRIEWADDLQAPIVDLALWNGDTQSEEVIATGLPAMASPHEWEIPATLPPGNHYRFVVRDHTQPRRALRSRSWVPITPAQPMVASLDHQSDPPALTIQPAPATNDVTLTWRTTTAVMIEIYDTKQQRLGSWNLHPGQTSVQIDISDLPVGIHHVQLLGPTSVIATQMLPIVR